MNNRQAIKVALECMEHDKHSHMFDANLYRRGLETGPHFENEHEKVLKIEIAMKLLQQLEQDIKTVQDYIKDRAAFSNTDYNGWKIPIDSNK